MQDFYDRSPENARDRALLSELTQLLSTHVQLQLGGRPPNRLDVSLGEASSGSSYSTCRSKSPYPGLSPARTFSLSSLKSTSSEARVSRTLTLSFSPATKAPTVPRNCYSVSPEDVQAIERGFHTLYSRLEGTPAARLSDNEPLICEAEVEELFLNAYVTSESTLRVLLEPLRRCKWVSIELFKRAVVRIYRSDLMVHNMSSKAAGCWKTNYSALKLLCKLHAVFCKLLSYNDCLHKGDLNMAVGLALKGSNETVQAAVVGRLLAKASAKRGFDSDMLTLKELFEVLKC